MVNTEYGILNAEFLTDSQTSTTLNPMPSQSLSPETILHMAAELLGTPISEEDAHSLATILGALATDMDAMRKMELADSEPATLYEARP
jgi:hypothetical protein